MATFEQESNAEFILQRISKKAQLTHTNKIDVTIDNLVFNLQEPNCRRTLLQMR